MLSRWKTVNPEGRRQILSALLSKKERLDALLTAVESSRIMPGEVDAVSRSVLLRHAEPSIRRRASALWGEEKEGTRDAVIQQFRKALELTGNQRRAKTHSSVSAAPAIV